MKLWFWKAKPLSVEERAVSDSIKALKTLTVRYGRVSIDPCEILNRPGYDEARCRAARLVRQVESSTNDAAENLGWNAIDSVGIETLANAISKTLQPSREAGMNYVRAVDELIYISLKVFSHD